MDASGIHPLLIALDAALVLGAIVWVLSTSEVRAPGQTLSWILAFLLLPVAGVVFYIAVGYRGFRRRRRYALARKLAREHAAGGERPRAGDSAWEREHPAAPTLRLGEALTTIPVREASRIDVLDDAFRTYGALAEAIRRARHSVHLEFYIFQPDETGLKFRDLLVERARAGVACRLLVDAVGSRRLSGEFLRPLREAGVQVGVFAPVTVARFWSFHFRNHRKIAVIDEAAGFIGSQNIGNEYLGWKNRNRSWRDIQLRIEGDAVSELSRVFREDWEIATGKQLPVPEEFSRVRREASRAVAPRVGILPTGPDEKEGGLEMVVCDLLARASREVLLVTPYFVPSLPVRMALQGAARRGVSVKLLIPAKSDQPLVDRGGRVFLPALLEAGVRIHEFTAAFVHAKVIVVDDHAALVGSANMDERSFRLNWEASAIVADRTAVAELRGSVSAMLEGSRTLTARELRGGVVKRTVDGLLRLLAPLL